MACRLRAEVGQVSPNTLEANQAHFVRRNEASFPSLVGDHQTTHMLSPWRQGAWAIVSSPLILGMNLSDQEAMDISWDVVTNKEVRL